MSTIYYDIECDFTQSARKPTAFKRGMRAFLVIFLIINIIFNSKFV
jgi:hypothetical protein